jgi:flagellar hook-associated protein 1 FlgK
MAGLFQGLEIGRRALMTHQVRLQTIGHNIANVDTPGYSRQRVNISNTWPENSPQGLIGTGVTVDDIRSIKDLFLGAQFRESQKSLGNWTYKDKALQQIESLFNEPQDSSLNDMLNDFWNSWSELSTNSDSSSNRNSVLATANQLVHGFHQLANSISELRAATDADLASLTAEVNRLTSEIGVLNQQIKKAELGTDRANDLRDQRDLLTDQLAGIIDVNVIDKDDGATVVAMGSMILVDGSSTLKIDAEASIIRGEVTHNLVWAGTEVRLTNKDGQLAGLIETRDKIIPKYMEQLNELARTLVEQVNAIHETGYGLNGTTGVAFFDPAFTDASNIKINQEITRDINRIAASQSPDGDNIISLALSDLRNAEVTASGSMTINDFYTTMVGSLGVEAREASSFTSNYELLSNQIDNQRQSVQGVSLDEEMANMVKSQHAYDAAARVITTMDEALDVVIRDMGIVGR